MLQTHHLLVMLLKLVVQINHYLLKSFDYVLLLELFLAQAVDLGLVYLKLRDLCSKALCLGNRPLHRCVDDIRVAYENFAGIVEKSDHGVVVLQFVVDLSVLQVHYFIPEKRWSDCVVRML